MKKLALTALVLATGIFAAQPTIAAPQKQAPKKEGTTIAYQMGHRVVFETTKGSFVIGLYPKAAPETVANFEKLVKKGFYNGLTFHRVIPGFVAQGGDPKGDGTGGPGWTVRDEKNPLKHTPGVIAMAKSAAPNSAGSQFYIALDYLPRLDGRYTVFGDVISGFDVIKKLQATERNGVPSGTRPDRMLRVYLR